MPRTLLAGTGSAGCRLDSHRNAWRVLGSVPRVGADHQSEGRAQSDQSRGHNIPETRAADAAARAVKVSATVAPTGKVVKTELIGGSPVFVPYALNAVSLLKWEPGPKETTEIVEIDFVPSVRQ
ncbi:MAG TPA: energy transducer TonB [Candidatus Sulfotelmatobacter sp.]